MLTLLALLPSLAVLVYIYKKDKKEKEPIRLLISCFILGVVASLPMVVVEGIEDAILGEMSTAGSVGYALVDGFIVAGLTEEFFKRLFLKSKTWKNKYFDCMFDGIVYSVFVSLGFATLENLFYVFEGGIGVALLRMFTSIPGHTCFAVFMGYYYSKAKLAECEGNLKECKKCLKKSLWIPVLLHGLYDCLIMIEEEAAGETMVVFAMLSWIVYVIVLFIKTFILINDASKDDRYIATVPGIESPMIVFTQHTGEWKCSCDTTNRGNFCTNCGSARPVIKEWKCPRCASIAVWNYCGACGMQKPESAE